jgi:50S ribosomal subunit-associated GTPase HflX
MPSEGLRSTPRSIRHQGTERLWAWFENGPGLLRNEADRAVIREQLEQLDHDLHRLDLERHRAR